MQPIKVPSPVASFHSGVAYAPSLGFGILRDSDAASVPDHSTEIVASSKEFEM